MNNIIVSPYIATDITVEEISTYSAKISIFPFSSGYAITLAHPIRRLILSSTAGYAPIGLKIEGAAHEFDNIIGMLEDVAVFIMNLKSIRFALKDTTKEEEIIHYNFSGHRQVLAKDLENDQVKITTPDQHLATLNNDANLNFSIIIKKGMGYVGSDSFREELEEDYIPVDAFFSPVKRAVYNIEKMLVKDDPSFEKVVFEITTDGQIKPADAFKHAVMNMNSQMNVFRKIVNIDNIPAEQPKVKKDECDIKDLLIRIEELNLTARSFNSLDKNNIQYLGQIITMTDNELKNIKNLGKKSYEEIIEKIKEHKFTLNYPLSDERRESISKRDRKNHQIRPSSNAFKALSYYVKLLKREIMRHKHGYRKLNRTSSHRKALLKNLAISLIEYEKIETTVPKAKELQRVIEKLITKSKNSDFNTHRYIFSKLQNKEATKKITEELAPKYSIKKWWLYKNYKNKS